MDETGLKDPCVKREAALKHENRRKIHGEELWEELIFIHDLLEKSMDPLDTMKILEKHPFDPHREVPFMVHSSIT